MLVGIASFQFFYQVLLCQEKVGLYGGGQKASDLGNFLNRIIFVIKQVNAKPLLFGEGHDRSEQFRKVVVGFFGYFRRFLFDIGIPFPNRKG